MRKEASDFYKKIQLDKTQEGTDGLNQLFMDIYSQQQSISKGQNDFFELLDNKVVNELT